MPKILYLIASHTNPAQVAILAERLIQGSADAQVLIHHDGAQPVLDAALFKSRDRIHIFPQPISVQWGSFSVVDAELRCIAWLLQQGIPFDWLVLLSGQDYPIQPLAQFEQLLAQTTYDGFIEHFPAHNPPATQWNWDKHLSFERYWFRYYSVPAQLKWLFRKLYRPVNWNPWLRVKGGRFGAKLALRRRNTPFDGTFSCYAGSQWHTLNRRCVEYIDNFVQDRPDIVEYYRHTMVPDESFFQTILVNRPDLELCNDNLRYISWTPPYPAILQSQDFDALIRSGKYFGRKFDITVDADICDRLDTHSQYPLFRR
ncbi:N-acetylglucosaminyltransferase [Nodosilinea sp. LEGE 07088]|uniref:beta-1,6-N-acetylglucosaminyltransferase n=1 Tax=Nodosilinea sp. LEGE 07088 TaxID=2777968 RepID=UPI0018804981|nr:beta-1,6-N-acetylglucosaminyltransferase [Nodosilinea sp. LEGE 07088]MBE9139444.1 N-acetylglucosaminyltransferase [Nodosilinea sp. LEGE 07088]